MHLNVNSQSCMISHVLCMIVLLKLSFCSHVAPPYGTTGWYAMCDCGISWLYSPYYVPNVMKMFNGNIPLF